MSSDISNAKGALTGERYIESLRDGREVWLDGKRVDDVTTHPAFSGMVHEMARIYDLQYTDEYIEQMTYPSAETGNRISYSYSLPRTYDEMMARKRNSEIWMQESFGQLGRTPDFCSSIVCGWYDVRDELAKYSPKLDGNAAVFHRYASEHDLALTHAIGDPQVDRRSTTQGENSTPDNPWIGVGGYGLENPDDDEATALHVVKETRDGIVLRGAKQLATLAPLSNECLVYLSATFSNRANNEYVQWFSIPMNTPGLVTVCREPLSQLPGSYGHPFGRRFDEQDAMMFFNNVLVPWDHVVMLYSSEAATRLLGRVNTFGGYSSNIRLYERIRTFVAVVTMLAKANEIDEIRGVRDMLGELVSYAEMIRLAIRGHGRRRAHQPGRHDGPGRRLCARHLRGAHLEAGAGRAADHRRHGAHGAAQRAGPCQPGDPPVHREAAAQQRDGHGGAGAALPAGPRRVHVGVRDAPGGLRVLAPGRRHAQPHQPLPALQPGAGGGPHQRAAVQADVGPLGCPRRMALVYHRGVAGRALCDSARRRFIDCELLSKSM